MLFILLAQIPAFAKQPTTMNRVEYQCVQHAMPDGTPDLKAPDNYYIKISSTWYLVADSSSLTADADGNRRLHVPGFKFKSYRSFRQDGRATGELADKFKEIHPSSPEDNKNPVGSGASPGTDMVVSRGNRMMYFYIRSAVEKVETHKVGRHQATRWTVENFWSVSAQGIGSNSAPFMPKAESMYGAEPGPHVQGGPVTYGYDPIVWPNDVEVGL